MNINGVEVEPDQLRYLLYRVFWKQTVDADLNTDEGCQQAATAATEMLAIFGEGWNLHGRLEPAWPGGERPICPQCHKPAVFCEEHRQYECGEGNCDQTEPLSDPISIPPNLVPGSRDEFDRAINERNEARSEALELRADRDQLLAVVANLREFRREVQQALVRSEQRSC